MVDIPCVARRGDMPLAEVAADFDVSEESVRRWKRQAEIDHGRREGLTTAEQAETSRIERSRSSPIPRLTDPTWPETSCTRFGGTWKVGPCF